MLILLSHFAIIALVAVRVLLRPYGDPSARLAWIVIVVAAPFLGLLAYIMVGEKRVGSARAARMQRVAANLPDFPDIPGAQAHIVAPGGGEHGPLFRVGEAVSGFPPVAGNRGTLLRDTDAAMDAMIADIEAATATVHIMFYIWLPDTNGTKMTEAVVRAAQRGVTCRVMVDALGSRAITKSALWQQMMDAGVQLSRALPVGNPLVRMFRGRIDLRNHRKLVVIDNAITYCGSQNCADPAFLPKAKYAPWVDLFMRFEGPVVRQNQIVFAGDWMAHVEEDLRPLLLEPIGDAPSGFTAQVVESGPSRSASVMPDLFEALMHCANAELIVTTPYYVPPAATQAALCAAARRGVNVTIIFPARNDDIAVAATSRSYYRALIEAGVSIFEYLPGLLHTKSLTVDGKVTLIGSSNLDHRSFELNFENNILFADDALTGKVRSRQEEYLRDSRPVTLEEINSWSWRRRLIQNAAAITGPVL